MSVLRASVVRAVSLLVLAGGVVGPTAARAQELRSATPPAWHDAPLGAPTRSAVAVETPRRDYRWLGTAIGAVALGLAAGLESAAACGNSEHGPRDCTGVTIGGATLGAALGGTIGHFVGRLFKRG